MHIHMYFAREEPDTIRIETNLIEESPTRLVSHIGMQKVGTEVRGHDRIVEGLETGRIEREKGGRKRE